MYMNKLIIGVIVGVLVVAIGIGFYVWQKPAVTPIPSTVTPSTIPPSSQIMPSTPAPPTVPRTVTVNLSAQNNSGEAGTATLTEVGTQTKVTLNLTGAPQGTAQPAHIHTGSCATIGGVKYALMFPRDGKSETTLSVTLDQLKNELPLAINVHKSAAEASVYYSCGDLKL